MAASDHNFLFSSLESKRSLSARKVHICRLYDILQLSIQRHDLQRARRAWAILARCKEVHWMSFWTVGLQLIGSGIDQAQDNKEKLSYLRSLMLQHGEEREPILEELVQRLILTGSHREALDELELYLPSFPYHDNPNLHLYAGMLSLYLAQSASTGTDSQFNQNLVRDAKSHLGRTKELDPENEVAQALFNQVVTNLNLVAH
ncbi:hypothetical protein AMATHDRAFT_142556 [Amanita thiersii Skay4041]|uniref:ER membrane protein complex subunit 2 n=1 Tax=Amanita thiersii Skay4041 TaxID=703135 RepID=A0A2A9NK76_9AGAR|nr:hypothetical protein AMATHDRAFT_142556 [Amanita thiersii Skay4041]